jgi:hypothetical protein
MLDGTIFLIGFYSVCFLLYKVKQNKIDKAYEKMETMMILKEQTRINNARNPDDECPFYGINRMNCTCQVFDRATRSLVLVDNTCPTHGIGDTVDKTISVADTQGEQGFPDSSST